ncbi:MAG: diacylglycerol kinase family protein [Chthoniobacter sp.]|nr:diacylglycerol kinase family protein [Chthoniobacter sp.]
MSDRPTPPPDPRGRFLRSFGYALRGVAILVRTQANARIHLGATALAVGLGLWCGIARGEWCAVIAAIGLVWTAEGLNTALETVVNLVSPDQHPLAARAKDVAAGAVLCAALAALIIGVLVFLPHLAAHGAG